MNQDHKVKLITQQNSDFVRGVYELFAKGDVPAVLDAMDTQIEWSEAEVFPYADTCQAMAAVTG